MEDKIRVNLIESESGWGFKIDEVKYFDTMEEAEVFVTEFNKHNDQPNAPDWYMYAEIV
jgi:hypothetical protein